MAELLPHDIRIESAEGRVTIAVGDVSRQLTAAEAERVLTGLQYAVGRATPGMSLGSIFVNGTLWGAKFVEIDQRAAIHAMQELIDRLARKLDEMMSSASEGDVG
jgi:hypothetical protein